MKVSPIQTLNLALIALLLAACNSSTQKPEKPNQIAVTTLQSTDVTLTQKYVCQIQSHHHITIHAEEIGYLDSIKVKEGQTVKMDDLLLKINYKRLLEHHFVPGRDATKFDAKLEKLKVNMEAGTVALSSTAIKAPFDGIVDRLLRHQSSLVQKGEALVTMSDNSLMRVIFTVPEARYLEYVTNQQQNKDEPQIELVLANGKKFDQAGKIGTIEADINSNTGTVPFSADFPNPDRLLRHGQVGTVLISQVQNDVIIVPQRATFSLHEKLYVYVVDKNDVAHRREIEIRNEVEDDFVIKSGVGAGDKIIVKAYPRIRDGVKVEYVDQPVGKVVANLKYHEQ